MSEPKPGWYDGDDGTIRADIYEAGPSVADADYLNRLEDAITEALEILAPPCGSEGAAAAYNILHTVRPRS